MKENALVASPRHVVLEELRGRLNARAAAVEKRLQLLQVEFEKLALERIELRAELHVLEEQMQKCKGEDEEVCELAFPAVALLKVVELFVPK